MNIEKDRLKTLEADDKLRKAAEQGDATAQFNLGLMYSGGGGVDQSYTECKKWWHKAADIENAPKNFWPVSIEGAKRLQSNMRLDQWPDSFIAIYFKRYPMLEMLMRNNPKIQKVNIDNITDIMFASYLGDSKALGIIKNGRKRNIDINEMDIRGRSALAGC